jgi:exopolysaccharide biosynthesis polyprenyl glycosylphosphotransferase
MRNRRFRDRFVVLQYLADSLGVAGGLLLAWWVRFGGVILPAGDPTATDYRIQFWWAFLLWLLCLHIAGCYVAHPQIISFNRARRIANASLLALMLIAMRNYFFRDFDVSRPLFPIAGLTVTALVVGLRSAMQLFITRFMVTRGVRSRVLIVGTGPVGLRLAARFRLQMELGYELVGFVTLDDAKVGRRLGGVPVLGGRDDLRRVLRDNSVDEVFVTQTGMSPDEFFQLFLDSEKETARVSFVPSLVEMMRSTIHYDEVAGVPVYSMRQTPLQGSNATIKRLFDIVAAGLGLVVLSPVLLVITLLVRRSSPGPVLYKQTRLGLDGKEFKIYKFRTMGVDAEAGGPGWGSQDDHRATRVGRFLRRWNLDELPQLWNVVRGDMSLVGPRPERPYFVDRFREVFPRYMARHTVKTGLTGWAQVHGLRGETSIPQRLRYDLYYIENWSLWLDIKILLLTFFSQKRRRRVAMRWLRPPASAPAALRPPSHDDEAITPCIEVSTDKPLG